MDVAISLRRMLLMSSCPLLALLGIPFIILFILYMGLETHFLFATEFYLYNDRFLFYCFHFLWQLDGQWLKNNSQIHLQFLLD